MIEYNDGTRRWLNCEHAVQGSSGKPHGEPNEHWNAQYGCTETTLREELMDSKYIHAANEPYIDMILLHPRGYTRDESVQRALQRNCAKCPFYKSRKS